MTVPVPPVVPPTVVPPAPAPAPAAVAFPLGWLLEHAAPPIQYRAITEVARLARTPGDAVDNLPYAWRPALLLAASQGSDGLWNRSMLAAPAKPERVEGVGTITAVRRLLEYGWDRESPPLARARRILFRLLAEDEDPAFLFELAAMGREEETIRHNRQVLREAAAAALAQAGYEMDPRVRGAARRILDRVNAYIKSPLSQKPWIRVGNKQVLSPDASPPSYFVLLMLAHMPQFRNECHEQVDRIYQYITQPQPRQESVQQRGTALLPTPWYVLGDMLPHRNAVEDDVPFAITWLELMARIGFLRRNENWTKMFERFVDDRDRNGVWHPHKGSATPKSTNAFVWPMFPLDTAGEGEGRWTDITFRIGLIARLAGRQIDVT